MEYRCSKMIQQQQVQNIGSPIYVETLISIKLVRHLRGFKKYLHMYFDFSPKIYEISCVIERIIIIIF
jgi:hypothetical protein